MYNNKSTKNLQASGKKPAKLVNLKDDYLFETYMITRASYIL